MSTVRSIDTRLYCRKKDQIMKKAFAVSYDLDKPGQDYTRLIARLRQLGAASIQKSQWVLANSASALDIVNDLRRYMDGNDRLFVVEIPGDWAFYNIMNAEKFQQLVA